MKQVTYNYGCLMGMVDEQKVPIIQKIGKTIIPDNILYIDESDGIFGYEDEAHVTIKYGFYPDLTKRDIASILNGTPPFTIKLKSISLFKNELYDVVKFDIELNGILKNLRSKCDAFPNQDKYPEYHPHMTLAYVKKDVFTKTKQNINVILPINKIKYSGANGSKLYIRL